METRGDPKTIVVVEDDAVTRGMVRDLLAAEGHRVLDADTAAVGLHLCRTRKPDLVILDVKLPDGSGVDLCLKLRESQELRAVPVVMLTGQGALEDKETGFSAGADQYIVKPVHAKELLLWVRALFERLRLDSGAGEVLKAGDLEIEPSAHLVRWRGQTVPDLTVREFDILRFLVKNRPQVVTRKRVLSQLLRTVAVDNLVDVHVSNLRRKLPREAADRIQTVPGKGFRYLE